VDRRYSKLLTAIATFALVVPKKIARVTTVHRAEWYAPMDHGRVDAGCATNHKPWQNYECWKGRISGFAIGSLLASRLNSWAYPAHEHRQTWPALHCKQK